MTSAELTILLALAGGGGSSAPGRLAQGLNLGRDTVRRALKRLQSGWLVLRRGQNLRVNPEHSVIRELKLAIAATSLKQPWTLVMIEPAAVEALGLLHEFKRAKISELSTHSSLSPSTLRKGVQLLLDQEVVVAGENYGDYVLAGWVPGVLEWAGCAARIREWLPFDSQPDPLRGASEDPRLSMALVYGSYLTPEHRDELSDIDLIAVVRDAAEIREVEADYKTFPKLDVSVMSERAFLKTVERQPAFAANLACGKVLKGGDFFEKCLKH